MNFIDSTWITVKSGDGGKGHVSFRREKFVPNGGPDGGNGGRGGTIIVKADRQLGTLLDFTYKRNYKAKNGDPGGKNNCTGKSAPDVYIRVPCGTVIRNRETGEQLADLDKDGIEVILAEGGRGGRGNQEFVTATNQVPRNFEPGRPGAELELELELKLLADVGLVGFPNAGKSTLISSISAAKPKIADYPFTTLIPNLGLVRLGEHRSYTVADIPGLIEGAHQGKGLGHQFLRHIERTAVLVFLIDCSSENPDQDLKVLRNELKQHEKTLLKKEYVVCMTKIDVLSADQIKDLQKSKFVKKHKARLISAVSGVGMAELAERMWEPVVQARLSHDM
ncbi:MAG: GTPase ObgE [Ignavibacteria bacterium]|nr:GTPase ObgE [Ignavibacteria bacterium]